MRTAPLRKANGDITERSATFEGRPAGQATASASRAIKRCNYTHDAMIDVLLAEPTITQNELALMFGVTVPWVSRILCSDTFQERRASRTSEIIDPGLRAEAEEGFKALVNRSLDVLIEKLNGPNPSEKTALSALEISSKALGYGARAPQLELNQQNIVILPAKEATSADWVKVFRPAALPAPASEPSDA